MAQDIKIPEIMKKRWLDWDLISKIASVMVVNTKTWGVVSSGSGSSPIPALIPMLDLISY
jgi:hypothetical protein